MATTSGSRTGPDSGNGTKMDTSASHPYTCNTCQVAFRNSDLQKSHMRTDWHRYNLKRRIATLPPISSEVFTEKVLQARAASTAEADKAGFEKACQVCNKTYYSENQYRNHIGSAKHKAKLTASMSKSNAPVEDDNSSMVTSTFSLGAPATVPGMDSDAEEEFQEVVEGLKNANLQDHSSPGKRPSPVKRPSNPHLSAAGHHRAEHPISPSPDEQPSESTTPTVGASIKSETTDRSLKLCLFCNYESPTLPLSVVHMQRIHGMMIPENNYLVNLEGLLKTLQARVMDLNECIFCGKVKANSFAVQTHMRDTGHCKIPYTTEEEQLEIGEFYDFRSTYSDGLDYDDEDESMDEATPNGGAKLGSSRQTKVTGEDGEEVKENEDGWETDSSESSLDSNDLHAVPGENHYHQYERLENHAHHSRDDHRAHHQRDGWHAHNHKRAHAVYYDDYELHLPSGKSVGHRSLNRYFRQNLHSHPSPEERAERLAIEAAEAENRMDLDGDSDEGKKQVVLRDRAAHGRAIINRENRGLGMTGITDPQAKQRVKEVVLKGRKKELAGQRAKEVGASKRYFKEKHRNHAAYLD